MLLTPGSSTHSIMIFSSLKNMMLNSIKSFLQLAMTSLSSFPIAHIPLSCSELQEVQPSYRPQKGARFMMPARSHEPTLLIPVSHLQPFAARPRCSPGYDLEMGPMPGYFRGPPPRKMPQAWLHAVHSSPQQLQDKSSFGLPR